MKNIKISEHEFQWQKCYYNDGDGDACGAGYTAFYLGKRTEIYLKYWFFGPKLTRELPLLAFTVPFHIDNPTLTNTQVRNAVMRKYEHWKELLDRDDKIAKGEFF